MCIRWYAVNNKFVVEVKNNTFEIVLWKLCLHLYWENLFALQKLLKGLLLLKYYVINILVLTEKSGTYFSAVNLYTNFA